MIFKRHTVRFSIFLLVISLGASSFSYAQRLTGKIVGTVFDTEGVPIPGVAVEITSTSLMGGAHAQVSHESGSLRQALIFMMNLRK